MAQQNVMENRSMTCFEKNGDLMEFHPIAEVWPLLDDDALKALAEDIKANGLEHPIVLYEGKVLDGRNRYRACEMAGVEPRYVAYDGNDPVGKAISLNEQRRHLDTSQRALVAARLATLREGRPAKTGEISPVSQGRAAEVMNVSRDSVKFAAKVMRDGTAALLQAVERGEIAVSTAAKLANLPPLEQAEALTRPDAEVVQIAQAAAERAAQPVAVSERKPTPHIAVAEWQQMGVETRAATLDDGRKGHGQFNQQDSDGIDWAQWSWNPVTGCLHDCPYCYARDIANRWFDQGFEPSFYLTRLAAPFNTKVPPKAEQDIRYKNVFVCSMADLFGRWVPEVWIDAVLDAARDAPQWNFLFLTKFPKRMAEFDIPRNAWMGTTVDCQARVANAEKAFENVKCDVRWLSIEPLIEPLRFQHLERFDWMVIGGASRSSQTPAWHPPRTWVDDLEAQARAAGCRVYHKPNLFAPPLREMPWDVANPAPERAPDAFHYLGRKTGEGA
jgi:protein gp37/ParB-like chromosome segregation protein Spo0J